MSTETIDDGGETDRDVDQDDTETVSLDLSDRAGRRPDHGEPEQGGNRWESESETRDRDLDRDESGTGRVEVVLALLALAGVGVGLIGYQRIGAGIVVVTSAATLVALRARGAFDARVPPESPLASEWWSGEGENRPHERDCGVPRCEGSIEAVEDGEVVDDPECRACGARYEVEVRMIDTAEWAETADGSEGTSARKARRKLSEEKDNESQSLAGEVWGG